MSNIWTEEKVKNLNNNELEQLYRNAKSKNNIEISQLCSKEIELRKNIKAASTKTDSIKKKRSAISNNRAKKFNDEMNEKLLKLANELSLKYDFSKETAKKLSIGTKGFKAHNLLDKKGRAAKTYGIAAQRRKIAVGRYLDYRIKDTIISIAGILLENAEESPLIYFVSGPEHITGKQEFKYQEYSLTGKGIWLDKYDEAESIYKKLVEEIVPKKSIPN